MIGSPPLAPIRHLREVVVDRLEDMREAEFPKVDVRRIILGTAGLAILLGAIGLFVQPAVGTALVAVGVIPWLWSKPIRGLYLLVGMVALIEQFGLGYPDSLTDKIPLWLNLNNTAGIPLSITPFEVLLGVIAIVTAARGYLTGRLHLSFGRLSPAYYGFAAVLLFGEINGLLTGGDFKLSLWELRPQAYGFIVFLLTGALVRERRQLVTLGIVFAVAEVMKAILGDWRYLFTMGRNLGVHETLLGHEDSYFLLLFLVTALAALAWWRIRRLWIPLVVASPLVALALIANERRAGILALVITLFLLAVIVIRYAKRARKVAIIVCAIAMLGLAGIVATSWNTQYGIRSEIVSPVRTVLDPGNVSARDLSSDLYRTAENSNLQFTFKLSPIIGYGFGKPFLTPTPMADISQLYSLWNVIPHNSLLWVPMRMGLLGMVTFWGLVGVALMEAIRGVRTAGDRLLQGVGAFVACAIVGELLFAYADLQLENPRNMVAWGILLGLVNVLPRLAARRKGAASLEAIDATP